MKFSYSILTQLWQIYYQLTTEDTKNKGFMLKEDPERILKELLIYLSHESKKNLKFKLETFIMGGREIPLSGFELKNLIKKMYADYL